HGEAKKFLEAHPQPASVAIIDLSNDFRLQANRRFQGRDFIYGLPELNRNAIKAMAGKENLAIANPGCFATTIQVGLLPLAQEGWLDEVYTTGITGSTGAGQSLSATSHFSWRANNIQAYKTLNHQHLGEIGESLLQCQRANETKASGGGQQEKQGVSANQNSLEISFVPWRGDFTRGIFVSSTITLDKPLPLLIDLFKSFYQSHPFTHVSKEPIFLKQVVNTNKALVQLEKVGTKLVIHSAMDNLLKGASGQAVQNMNLLFRRPETEGLQLKAGYF
ncbi:MAG TPA: N-acetyl-gamma-glutamyl-phosphate reductase, partial [Flavihumibacter sp.]|nr:N-acetyl-gamma-glutamyl-phosphate reductase [Flavihumibacter sp.]